jgi:hypothetical protein
MCWCGWGMESAENQMIFLAALVLAALLIARGVSLIRHPELQSDGRCSQTDLLIRGIGRLPAISLILAGRLTLVLILPTALLVSAGFAFNEIFLHWFPNFGFAFLLLAAIGVLHLAGERFALACSHFLLQCVLVAFCCSASPAWGDLPATDPSPVDTGINFTPEVMAGALLLFLGTDYIAPDQYRDSRLPSMAALLCMFLLFVFWAVLSLQYVGQERLAATTVPHLLAAREVWGQTGRVLMGCIIICGSCAAVNSLFHLASRSLASLAEQGLLPGHPPGAFRRRRFILLFVVLIGGLMAGGLAGYSIIEVYVQATLLLWLMMFAMLCLAAGRILMRRAVPYSWHGPTLAAVFTVAIIFLARVHDQAMDLIRFTLLTLAAATGLSLLWLWKRPGYAIINPTTNPKEEHHEKTVTFSCQRHLLQRPSGPGRRGQADDRTTELKDMLGSKELVILDVRSGRDWSTSELKIKGAIRAGGDDFDSWANTYPKEKKIVLYCA